MITCSRASNAECWMIPWMIAVLTPTAIVHLPSYIGRFWYIPTLATYYLRYLKKTDITLQ